METIVQMKERLMTLALKKHKTLKKAADALGITDITLRTFKNKLKKEKNESLDNGL
tara:strand:- start:8215 stop:8382 length:168 start_codon:yes stop_codon:yes gene_type:complete